MKGSGKAKPVQVLPSQATLDEADGRINEGQTKPIPYTGSPLLLCFHDLLLFFANSWSIPGVLWPFWSSNHNLKYNDLDELYPTPGNLLCITLHTFLIVFETTFLLSLGFLVLFPIWSVLLYFGAVAFVVWGVSTIINGTANEIDSDRKLLTDKEIYDHSHESWIFLNGVSVGKYWLQGNVNRLSLIFRRPVIGLPNRTYGIVFDLLQCIIERDFCYATSDIRHTYSALRTKLLDEHIKHVVFISHSQGALEASLLLDWLLAELPSHNLRKLEIYTFGCAANHFNNPVRDLSDREHKNPRKAIRRIEHYAHTGDFVACWGVLTFAKVPNRFMGRVFIQEATGHLLNQHYLNDMFPLDPQSKRVIETGGFMGQELNINISKEGDTITGGCLNATHSVGGKHEVSDANMRESFYQMTSNSGATTNGSGAMTNGVAVMDGPEQRNATKKKRTVGDFSRLWSYRNGNSPKDVRVS